MKAQSLRIGNTISVGGKATTIENIHTKYGVNLEVTELWDSVDFKKIEPVPITDEWLKKFKLHVDNEFVAWGKRENIKHIFIMPGLYLIYKEGWRLGICGEDQAYIEAREDSPEIKYVHELQNLYYALTGKELELVA